MGRWVKQKFKDQKKKTKNSREKWGKNMDCPKTHKYKWVIYEIMCNCIIIKYMLTKTRCHFLSTSMWGSTITSCSILWKKRLKKVNWLIPDHSTRECPSKAETSLIISRIHYTWVTMIELFFFYFGSSNVSHFSSFQMLVVCNTIPTLSHCP